MTDVAGATHVAEVLRKATHDLNIVHTGTKVSDRVTLSVGGASCVPGVADSPLDLVNQADQALYEAKASGRNRLNIRKIS
jgi:diguanylate cyclase (GGDEF)-like protein